MKVKRYPNQVQLDFILSQHDEATGIPGSPVLNLSDMILEDLDLGDRSLFGIHFTDCTFSNVKLRCTAIQDCMFTNCIIEHSDMSMCKIEDSKFKACTITYSNLESLKLKEVTFSACSMNISNLSRAVLANVRFDGCNITDIDFPHATSVGTSTRFDYCELKNVRFHNSMLALCIFLKCNFNIIKFGSANLSQSRFSNCTFKKVDFFRTNLNYAELKDTDLSGVVKWEGTILVGTDLSGSTGLLDPIDYLKDNFEFTKDGVIVYKIFGLVYSVPKSWDITPGAEIKEITNREIVTACSYGINVGTAKWISEYSGHPRRYTAWKCLIPWEYLPGVVIPLGTDGKIRTSRLRLLEVVSHNEVLSKIK